MNLSAKKNKIELLTDFEILNGTWTGNANIVVDDIFEPTRKVSLTYISPNSGYIKSEGVMNNNFEFLGTINLGGMWLIPETRAEIEKTDLKIDVQAALHEGLKGINAKIWSDTTLLKYSTLPNDFPIRIRGELKDGMLEMNEISTQNEFGDLLIATLLYDLQQMRLEAIDISTEKYTLEMDSHTITLRNVTSHLEDAEDQMSIVTSIPSIQYKFNDETFGTANLIGKSDITLNIPHTQERQIKNKRISGNFIIDKLVYR